jgi:Fic family protein
MKRGPSGRIITSRMGGEDVRVFVPFSLPPDPPLEMTGQRQALMEQALIALGRLDALSSLLPDPRLFLYAYIRKEAVLSSQIEGTQSSLSDLLLFEMEEAPGVPLEDVLDVSNYVAALEHGLSRMRGGFPLSNRLLREMHTHLLSRGRGRDKLPGEFRRSQNWVGGTRPGNAHYIPPPPDFARDCMGELELFLNDGRGQLPILVRAALAHVQLESIHPFLDGNGRIGRLLITLVLWTGELIREPLLYLSLYLKEHRTDYYRLLDQVRSTGDWEAWVDFFLEGVHETAEDAVETARRMTDLFQQDRARLRLAGRQSPSALRLHQALMEHPVLTLPKAAEFSGLSFPAVNSAMNLLTKMGVAREITGRKRNRVFTYQEYIEALNQRPRGRRHTTPP